MKLLLIIGEAAVGKMTVGQKVCEITPFKLFHNHMTIEPVLEVFGEFNHKAIARIREVFFEEFAQTDNYGLIFTCMFDFDSEDDWKYNEKVTNIFKKVGAEIYYVELVAPLEVRLERNKTPNRLENKASKRDIESSEKRIINSLNEHRCVSYDGELTFENYLKIDNTFLSPEEVAKIIKEKFNFDGK